MEEQKKKQVVEECGEKYKALFDHSHDAVLIIKDYNYVEANKRAFDLFKADPKSLLGKSPAEWSPEFQPDGEKSEDLANKLLALAYNDKPMVFEWQHFDCNGKLFDVSISLNRIEIKDKALLMAVLRDITELKSTRIKLKKSEDRLEKVVYATTDGMWDWDLTTNAVFFDPRYYELAGYIPNEFPHEADEFFSRIHPEDVTYVRENVKQYISGQKKKYFTEFRFRKKDNSYMWIQGKGVIIERDSDGKPLTFVGTHTDINDRCLIQEELQKHKSNLELLVQERTYELQALNEELTAINEELIGKNDLIGQQKNEIHQTLINLQETQSHLIQSEKMASLGLLTAGVAHEINNPLNFISVGHAGLVKYCEDIGIEADENLTLMLDSIKTGVERASKIVSGLNLFSRAANTKLDNCDIKDIINNSLLMLNNKTKNRIIIEKHFSKNNTIIGNSGRLHQVFLNILLNAAQAIENKGEIFIKTIEKKTELEIVIRDTGCGIPKKNLNKIMDPFFTTKEVGKGTGLGLSISFNIINEHKGTLEFASKKGEGTTVKITLPKQ